MAQRSRNEPKSSAGKAGFPVLATERDLVLGKRSSDDAVVNKTIRVTEEVLIGRTAIEPLRSESLPEPLRSESLAPEFDESWVTIAAQSSSPVARLHNYSEFVHRTVEVFGDELKASRWLSLPSSDLNGRIPLEVAQSLQFDPSELSLVFEPLFTQIEHGVYS